MNQPTPVLRFGRPDRPPPPRRRSWPGCLLALLPVSLVCWIALVAGSTVYAWVNAWQGGQYLAWVVWSSVLWVLVIAIGLIAWQNRRDQRLPPPQLVLDTSGITIERGERRDHYPWAGLALVGVLLLHTSPRKDGEHVLMARPVVGGPRPKSRRSAMLLSGTLRRLGYVGLCSTEWIGASPDDVVAGLKRLAPDRVADSVADFRRQDPRLPPDM